jgi:hypothetical protein
MKYTYLFIALISFFHQLNAQTFTDQTGIVFPGLSNSAIDWGDYDNDGDLDILITGNNSSYNPVSKIYKNNGNNTFSELSGVYLYGISHGSAKWGDYDNDGDLDILLAGVHNSYNTYLYKNNGNSTFSLQSISLTGVQLGSVEWGDYDNDGDLDILLAGSSNNGAITKIYKNNGNNDFTEQTKISIIGVYQSSVSWGDYNNDGFLDFIIAGYNSNSQKITKIYKNNGNSSFSEQSNIAFKGVSASSVDWGDYDNDGDLDILLTGYYDNTYYTSTNISKIYKNNGNNTFTEQTSISLTGISRGDAKWGDYDNDGDLDILLSGWYGTNLSSGGYTTKIYKNNGNNSFTEQTSISLPGLIYSKCSWADYDNDGDLDILISGKSLTGPITKLYKNNSSTSNTAPSTPSGLSTQIIGDQLKFTWNNSTDNTTPTNAIKYNLRVGTTYSGINVRTPQSNLSNGFRRIVERGLIQDNVYYMKLANIPSCSTIYWSVQAIDNTFKGSGFSSTASKSNTLIISASNDTIIPIGGNAQLSVNHNACNSVSYNWAPSSTLNNSNIQSPIASPTTSTTYTVTVTEGSISRVDTVKVNVILFEAMGSGFTPLSSGDLALGDYDNDGDLDLLSTGTSNNYSNVATSLLYKNDGNFGFSVQSATSITGIYNSSVDWGDYNNDGFLDFIIAGKDASNNAITKIYKNNGASSSPSYSFSEQTSISLEGASNGSVSWADYNNDGFLDILITGYGNTSSGVTSIIYKNNGDNTFTKQNDINLTGIYLSSSEWGDFNNDGYIDILMSGFTGSTRVSKIYKNNGGNGFSEFSGANLQGVHRGSVSWGDYNNDGNLDILLTGYNSSNASISKIYKNNGSAYGYTFTEQSGITLAGAYYSSTSWGDYDNDGDLDIILSGTNKQNTTFTKIYKNTNNNFTEQTTISVDGIKDGFVQWADLDNDKDLDFLYSGFNNDSYSIVSGVYKNNTLTANQAPSIPTGLNTQILGDNILFSWNNSNDNNTSTSAITYNLRVGSTTNAIDLKSPLSNISNGYHKVVKFGDIRKNSYKMKAPINVSACSNIYWSVQAIDNGYLTSNFSSTNSIANVFRAEATKDTTITIGDSTHLFAKNNACGTATYSWTPSNSLSNANIQNPIASPTASTTYHVSITSGSQTLVDSVTIGVKVFEELNGTSFTGLQHSKTDWGDYDNDGDLDFIIIGTTNGSYSGATTKIYTNNGNNSFTELSGVAIVGVYNGDVKWGDYDNDGDLDIVISGYQAASPHYISKVYKNNGNNTFTEKSSINLQGFTYSTIDWGDYNNDGYIDLAIGGYYYSGYSHYNTIIYKNDKNGGFTSEAILGTGAYGSVEWGDMDNDGDLDLLVTGYYNNALTYENNGNGTFSANFINLDFVKLGKATWGDYDGDGDLDILLSGKNSSNQGILKVYKNNGYYNFSEQTSISLEGVYNSSVEWGDYDNDGDLDILFTGTNATRSICGIYTNIGNNSFSGNYQSISDGINYGDASFGDFDNDKDLDIIITGQAGNIGITKLFENKTTIQNTKPIKPSISCQIINDKLNFVWNKANDNNTPAASITYNLSLGNAINRNKYKNTQSLLSTGFRKVINRGNMQFDTAFSYDISNYFAGEKFFYKIQAIDNSYIGSGFSDEDTIQIPLKIEIQRIDTVSICPRSYSLNVIDNYDTLASTPLSYQWLPTTGLSNANIKNPIATAVGNTIYHLTVSSADGLIATDSFEVEINALPTSDFSLQSKADINTQTSINYTGNANTLSSYTWGFDGANIISGSGQGPYQVLWDSTGTKNLYLLVNSNGCISDTTFMDIDIAPIASFNITDSLCKLANTNITYNGTTLSSASYTWDFDGASVISGTSKGPYSLKWNSIGMKHISLIVNDNGVASDKFTDSIFIKTLPIANYNVTSPILITDTVTLTFIGDTSSIINYNWNLDGGTSILNSNQNTIKAKWNTTGIKNTSLIVTANNNCSSQTESRNINVGPTAFFNVNSSECVNSDVLVTYNGSASLSAYYNWDWDGGVVISGNGQGPYQVRWSTAGIKNIKLIVSENNVSSEYSTDISIQSLPSANFAIADSLCDNSVTTINYLGSAGTSASYSWNFGGATIISGIGAGPYQVKWTTTGAKNVSLSVSENGCSSNQYTKSTYIIPRPIASFNMPLTASVTDTIPLNYTGSVLTGANYNWNFDNANIISGNNQGPYLLNWDTTGIHTVSLYISNQNSCSSATASSNIQIAPSANFSADSLIVAGNYASISYNGGASQSAIYNWNFDGGTIISGSGQGPYQISWTEAGTKNISLIVIENNISSSQHTVQTIVKPTANINLSQNTICDGDTCTISYTGSASPTAYYNWNFTNAQLLSGIGQGPYKLIWNSQGRKHISLSVTENGQSSQTIDSIEVIIRPSSSFTSTDSACLNSVVSISYTGSSPSTDTYYWNFDGGTIISGSGQGPYQVSWANAANHIISLAVNNNICSSTLSSDTIIIQSPSITSFALNTQANNMDTVTISYTGTATNNATYNWSFDGGTVISGTNQGPYEVQWQSSGIKTVDLSVTDANSCISPSYADSITILPNSDFTVSNSINTGDTATITYIGIASSSSIYNWNFDGGIIISGTAQGPYQIKWDNSGIKSISLSITENNLTSPITTKTLNVKPTALFTHSQSVCQGDTTIITYQGSADSNAYYFWNFNGGMLVSGAGQGPMRVYWYDNGVKQISLIVVENGIASDLFSDSIVINKIYSSSFIATSPLEIGDTCSINYTGNAPSYANYSWDFNNAIPISGSGDGPYSVKWNSSGIKALKLSVSLNSCISNQTFLPVAVLPSSNFLIDTLACTGDSVSVVYTGTASVSAQYNWYFDNAQILSGSGQGPYKIRWLTNGVKSVSLTVYENGQTSTTTTHSSNVLALPSVAISSNNNICLYDSITLTSVVSGINPMNYLWSSSDTTITSTVSPIHDSLFWLQITDSNGCVNSDTALVNVKEPFNNEEICIVTVDSSINKNVVVWSKTPGVSTDYFKIYKESSVINVYDSIGFVPYDSLSLFIDTSSYPDIKSNRYKISVVDSCGNESSLSLHHKTMHLAINKGIGWTFNLIWTTYEGFQVQTYRIWRWTYASGWSKIDSVSGGTTSYTDSPPNGLTYYAIEIVAPYPCEATKANTNYNISRSNTANTSMFNSITDYSSITNFNVFPNPYFKETNINYTLNRQSEIQLEVYSILGERIAILYKGMQISGTYHYTFNASEYGYGAGIYYLRLNIDNALITKKMVEVK